MINLSIAANNHHDLHEQLKGILYGLAQTTPTLTVENLPASPPATQAEPKLTKKQIAEKAQVAAELLKKAEPVVEQQLVVEVSADKTEIIATVEPVTEVPTLDDLRASLMSLSKAEGHGSEAVFKLLETFNAKNASTVREDQRALVIAAVKQKLEG